MSAQDSPSPLPNDPPDPDGEGLEEPELEPAPDLEPPEEEEEDGAGEPELEPELAPGLEPEANAAQASAAEQGPTPKQLTAIERAHTAHERKLREIMGPAFALFQPCPTCEAAGFVPIGAQVADELDPLPGAIECPSCHGHGRLSTPSKVPGQETQVCVTCAGLGWKHGETAAPEPAPAQAAPIANGAPSYAGLPPGYIAVKIDPNAPDLPAAPIPHPVAAPAVT